MATVATKNSNRGGARPGAGRKAQGPDGEVKEKYMGLRLYPSDRVLLDKQYGSVQAAVENLIDYTKKIIRDEANHISTGVQIKRSKK